MCGNATRKTTLESKSSNKTNTNAITHNPSARHIYCQPKHACSQHPTFQMRQNKPTIKSMWWTNDDSWDLKDQGLCVWISENKLTDFKSHAHICSMIPRSISGLNNDPKIVVNGQIHKPRCFSHPATRHQVPSP